MNGNNNILIIIFFSLFINFANAKNEKVQIGDLIQINLPGESTLNRTFQVDKRGRINLPEVGPIYILGYTEKQLQNNVTKALKTAFRDLSSLNVFISKQQILISLQGYIKSPGEYILPSNSDVQMAIHAAGGLRSGAQLDKMLLKRGSVKKYFNYKDFLDSGNTSQLPSLQSLDIIFIPASPLVGNIEQAFDSTKLADSGDSKDTRSAIKIFGEVNAPGSFAYKEDIDLIDILMRSGGVTRYASVEQIRIISNNSPKLFNLKSYLDSGNLNLLPALTPGTTIFVPKQEEEIKSGFNTVYVMGEVAHPGAYESKKGATFIDILANAGGPTRFAESRQIRIIKANQKIIRFDLTNYTEGLTDALPPIIYPGDSIFVPEKTDMNEKSWLKVAANRAVSIIGQVTRPGRIEWSDEMNLIDLLAHVGGPTDKADTTKIEIVTTDKKIHLFNLDSYMQNGASISDLPIISSGAIIRVHTLPQDPTNNKSQWIKQSSDASIYILGQVNSPGRYRFTKEMHFLDILSAADGPNKDADIHNIRVAHRDKSYSQVSKLNLALYFETGDENLLPSITMGDTIYIPEKNRNWLDKSKESTVRVLGAVNNPGRYMFNGSMTILDILAEAGGPSNTAYLEKISIINMSCCQNQSRTFNFIKFATTADIHQLPIVRSGDTIYVPDRTNRFLEKVRIGLENIARLTTTIALIGTL
ncbi:polysaccharide export protein [Candidatus Photodesmus blepharus]|uniref:Polysaccharide export protein n=1 Tax=Candidatus Photodesmus blepharonis TaxID=1179155 RepID=A0A084CPM2_9GAMM|nr:SLBB domain-containing protein [Candidatus Photodesmus blepharus]KEY91751.1 polysaccharide export protein [Candidatus Photodesmus blepharus]